MIPFEQINRAALAAYPNLLRDLFPAGRIRGKEFIVGNLHGDAGTSLSINIRTGQWADFATEAKGGDPVSLFAAAFHGGNQVAAAKDLGTRLGVYLNGHAKEATARQEPKEQWEPGIPPSHAPVPDTSGFDHIHAYLAQDGSLIRYVYRKEASEGGRKLFVPFTWGVLNGVEGWHKKHPKELTLYGLDRLSASDNAVIVCEGEKAADAAAALFPDNPCIAWSSGAQNVLRNDWMPLKGRKVIIWPDNDTGGLAAAGKLAEFLTDHAAKVAVLRVDDLPEKSDAADIMPPDPIAWIKEHLPAPKQDLAPDKLPLVWFDDIEPCLDVLDFVQGVLVEGSGAVVYGDSNAGKTFWTTDLALHVAAGKKWNDRRVEKGGVVYCVLEGGAGFRNRVAAWRHENALDGIRIPFAAIPSSLNLLDPTADTPRLIERIQDAAKAIDVPVKLVVIDTLSRAMAGGNENAPDDMGALVGNMDAIRQATGACVLFVHHSGKDQARGARGHSLLRAAIDTEIEVVEGDGENRTATVEKQREMKKGDAFGFNLKVIELGQNRHGEAVTTCITAPCEASEKPTKKLKFQKLNPNAVIGTKALNIALSKNGAILPPTDEYPRNAAGVSITQWRSEFYDLKGGTADTNKHAFSRAQDDLVASGIIGCHNGLIWFVKRSETGHSGTSNGTQRDKTGHGGDR